MQITKISNVKLYSFKGQHFELDNPKQAYRTSETKKLMQSLEVLASVNSASVSKQYQVKNKIADISEKAHVYGDKLQRAEVYCTNMMDNILYHDTDFSVANWYFRNNPDKDETIINNFKYKKEQLNDFDNSIIVTRTADNTGVLFNSEGKIRSVKYRDLTIFTNGFFGTKDDMRPAAVYRDYTSENGEITASEMFDFNDNQVYVNLAINEDGNRTYDEFYEFSDNTDKKQLTFFDDNETKIELIDKVTRYSYMQDGNAYQVTTNTAGI